MQKPTRLIKYFSSSTEKSNVFRTNIAYETRVLPSSVDLLTSLIKKAADLIPSKGSGKVKWR